MPSLDLASVNNSLQIATKAEKASESLKVNDQLLLEKTDLKTQLKMFKKGITAKGKASGGQG